MPTLIRGSRQAAVAFAVLPAAIVALGAAVGALQWKSVSDRETASAAADSVEAARMAAVKLMSYQADSLEQDFAVARDQLTGPFLDSYTDLVNTVVIPAARQRKLSAVAEVVGAASVSASPGRAVALVFMDQRTTTGTGDSKVTPSTVRVQLDKVDGRWLVSAFDPV